MRGYPEVLNRSPSDIENTIYHEQAKSEVSDWCQALNYIYIYYNLDSTSWIFLLD